MKRIIIIGAGASGVYLSVLLKKKLNEKVSVIVLEQNSSSLKKLLATGNGRCNLSNKNMSIDYYQSDNQEIVQEIIDSFDMKDAMADLGLLCQYQSNLLYPRSEQALSVKRVLMSEAERLGVLFLYEQEVYRITREYCYQVYTQKQSFSADYVVFAMGSEAGKLSGVNQSRYDLLKKLGLDVIPSYPSLVQMKTQPVLKQLKGVRVKGTFSLLENGYPIHVEKGELLFTDYGVSGIAIMQLSAFCQPHHQYEISIDFFDDIDERKFNEFIELRMNKEYNHFYDGLINSKISSYLETLDLHSSQDIVQVLKDMRFKVIGLRSYETAQVMKGGLSLHEVDHCLEMKKYPHMYAIGEILNVTGMCGGYNLHFAFSSANTVANAIKGDFYDKDS